VVASFKDVCFGYGTREILEEVAFSVREGSKITIMGQNGAGKSSIIKLLSDELYADSGVVNIKPGETVAVAKQTMPVECREMTVKQYFESHFDEHNSPGPKLDARIATVLNDVELVAPAERLIRSFSGGQQARLLLAGALITEPSILLLDEPTNNLDAAGIRHLKDLIISTDKTCMVISHDEDFLNSFTDSVLYLDMFSRQVESYNGDYFFVKSEIDRRVARENMANARLAASAKKKTAQAGVFANKGGGMRLVAKRMRAAAADMKDSLVDVRREDESLKNFVFPFTLPSDFSGNLLTLRQLSSRCPSTGDMVASPLSDGAVKLNRKSRLRVVGPNGCGKTTFLELVAKGAAPGLQMVPGLRVGYYRQDFHNFDFSASVLACLERASNGGHSQQEIRNAAGSFMLRGDIALQAVATLSEGQKALLSLACLVLERPAVLIMDEPTNHVNFRHLPGVAAAVRDFEGAVILVTHDTHFAENVGIEKELDMGYELSEEGRREGARQAQAEASPAGKVAAAAAAAAVAAAKGKGPAAKGKGPAPKGTAAGQEGEKLSKSQKRALRRKQKWEGGKKAETSSPQPTGGVTMHTQ
jgi:ATPase subunit of ABC transporter with duplicated ATPase domains